MTTEQRLAGRISLLSDFGISVDEVNDIIYFHYNRKLDCPITWLKHLSIPRFTQLLTEAQEAFIKYTQKV